MISKFLANSSLTAMGWKFENNMPAGLRQCVMIAAPHTSNWDSLYTKLAFLILDIPVKITIKDSYMRLPFGPFVRALGGIGIDRTPKKEGEARPSMVQEMAKLFESHPDLVMLVTPEGTRALRTKWKTGFYHVAMLAGVPIALGYVDYARKEAGVGKVIYPSGDLAKDMKEIMAFYQHIQGKYPENFSIDLDYNPDEL